MGAPRVRAIPLIDAEAGDYLNQVCGGADAFLFGRRTYEIFAGYWGVMRHPSTAADHVPGHHHPELPASRPSGVCQKWILGSFVPKSRTIRADEGPCLNQLPSCLGDVLGVNACPSEELLPGSGPRHATHGQVLNGQITRW